MVGVGHLQGDAFGRVDGDGVGVAEEELDALALGDGAVTGADDLKSLGVAIVNTLDHAGHDGAGQTVLGTGRTQVISGGQDDLVAFNGSGDADGELTNMRCHVSALLSHHTKATISPPMPRSRHSF